MKPEKTEISINQYFVSDKLTQDPVVDEDDAPLLRELRLSRLLGGGGCCDWVLAVSGCCCAVYWGSRPPWLRDKRAPRFGALLPEPVLSGFVKPLPAWRLCSPMRWRFFGMTLVVLRRELDDDDDWGGSIDCRERSVRDDACDWIALFTLPLAELSVDFLLAFSLAAFRELLARNARADFSIVFLFKLFLSLLSTLCSSWLSSSTSLSLSSCERELRDDLRLFPVGRLLIDVSKSTARSTDCVRERVRYAIKSLTLDDELWPSPDDFFVAGVTLLEWIVELVANDDEYDEDVELEKLRRRRFVFLFGEIGGTSSSVSSSVVVLLLFKSMFSKRFRGTLLLLDVVVVAVVFEEDDDDSDLRFLIIAKNREKIELCNNERKKSYKVNKLTFRWRDWLTAASDSPMTTATALTHTLRRCLRWWFTILLGRSFISLLAPLRQCREHLFTSGFGHRRHLFHKHCWLPLNIPSRLYRCTRWVIRDICFFLQVETKSEL